MAAFLKDQLDFIFFFYGLAFILLGATCWIATSRGAGRAWALLGAFGLAHGASEWLDLTALIVGDSPAFAAVRMAVMAGSFLLLLDFARMEGIDFGLKLPGRWVYVILALAVALIAVQYGTNTGGIVARYAIGFVGAGGAGVALAWRGRAFPAARGFSMAAAGGFVLYAVLSGLVVPAGSFWPSSVLNYGNFTAWTGMPVQLLRGLLACGISFSIWAIWSQRVASDVASPRYMAYVREQFTWTLVILGAILVSGWTLTQYLGGIYRDNVQREARADVDLLASRLAGDTATTEAMVQSLAGSPSILPLLTGGNARDREVALSVLDLDIAASGAERGYILDRGGKVVASSDPRDMRPGAAIQAQATEFLTSLNGRAYHHFSFDPREKECDYSVSYPIRDGDGKMAGVAVLRVSLASFEADMREFDRPYFFIDPNGVVLMTNRQDALYRTLWPLSENREAALRGQLPRLDARPMLDQRIVDESWVMVDGERNYVRRRFVDSSDWSLVILKPPRQIFATRFLGIVITLLVTIMALIYLLGRARRIHDEVERNNRLQLQELADDLGVKATTDTLTGLHNRLKFETVLAEEMRRADRYQTPLTLIMFDIDHFKVINDTYGHAVGDKVLAQLSRLVSGCIRSSDLLARWGGEEFVVLMPGIDGQDGFRAAQKYCDIIGKADFEDAGTVTCSFGVAAYEANDTAAAFVARVDGALYRAKESGRNQVRLAGAP